ncbi:MAG: hypothetical protein ACM3US_02440 [Sphingomonadaceae bacterium]
MAAVRCPQCRNTLGELVAGCWVMHHDGRELVMRVDSLVSVRCERCHLVWTADRKGIEHLLQGDCGHSERLLHGRPAS